jgi:2-polyprenyl-3-methyl-5-hydroxy-6-metoxy-1,4-benzoquinol methylase
MSYNEFSNTEEEFCLYLRFTNEKQVAAQTIFDHLSRGKSHICIRRILDVGCANGEILNKLVQMLSDLEKVEVTLIEPNSRLLEFARSRLQHVGLQSIVSINKKIQETRENKDYIPGFNLIIASQVLNYVLDVRKTLEQLFAALAPNGQLCLSLLMPDSDIFVIRSMFLNYFRKKKELGIHSEELLESVNSLGWKYDTQEVSCYVSFPISDVQTLLRNPTDLVMLRCNVAGRITRFIGNSPTPIIPPILLKKIAKLYFRRAKSGIVYLESKDRFIWIEKSA